MMSHKRCMQRNNLFNAPFLAIVSTFAGLLLQLHAWTFFSCLLSLFSSVDQYSFKFLISVFLSQIPINEVNL